jgi:hypothetical protein
MNGGNNCKPREIVEIRRIFKMITRKGSLKTLSTCLLNCHILYLKILLWVYANTLVFSLWEFDTLLEILSEMFALL